MNLPELYAAVVEKHPRLAIDDLIPPSQFQGWECSHGQINTKIAAALIADHWTESLPWAHFLTRAADCDSWGVNVLGGKAPVWGDTRLAALGAFWMAYEAEGK